MSNSLWPRGLQSASLLCSWDFPGKNTRVECRLFPSPGDLLTQVELLVKNPPADGGDVDSISVSRRSLGGGHGNCCQYSCLKNPMDRGAWRAVVHGIAKSQTLMEQLSTSPRPLSPGFDRALVYRGWAFGSSSTYLLFSVEHFLWVLEMTELIYVFTCPEC